MPDRQVPTTPQKGAGYMPIDEAKLNGQRENAKYLALTWANYVLDWAGEPKLEELPKGIQGSPEQCPLGRAIGAPVSVMDDGVGATCNIKGNRLRKKLVLPEGETEIHVSGSYNGVPGNSVGAFITGFDAGEYPELIEEDN